MLAIAILILVGLVGSMLVAFLMRHVGIALLLAVILGLYHFGIWPSMSFTDGADLITNIIMYGLGGILVFCLLGGLYAACTE